MKKKAFQFARRSLVIKHDIEKGEKITLKNIEFKRPGTGISPTEVNKILNKIVKKKLRADSILKYSDLQDE